MNLSKNGIGATTIQEITQMTAHFFLSRIWENLGAITEAKTAEKNKGSCNNPISEVSNSLY